MYSLFNILLNNIENLDLLLILVGGGINNREDLVNVWNAGADIAVIGTAIEKDFNNILLFNPIND